MGWAADEFKKVDLGDKRLDSRLIKLCDPFSHIYQKLFINLST